MSQFEYLAVFVAIIFGISVTHILAGLIRSIYRQQIEETHFVLTAFFFLVLILNWWTGYSWQSQEVWSYGQFLVIIIWSLAHYLAAITLYPPQAAGIEQPFEYRRNWFLWAFIGVCSDGHSADDRAGRRIHSKDLSALCVALRRRPITRNLRQQAGPSPLVSLVLVAIYCHLVIRRTAISGLMCVA